MYEYRDISTLTRTVVVVLWAFMICNLLFQGANFYKAGVEPEDATPGMIALFGLTGLLQVLTFVAAVILVGRWIYRASVNAHAMADDLTVTPGWAVGWYFIPFANLVKPFEAMKQTWLACLSSEHLAQIGA